MAQNRSDLLDVLKFELRFLDDGGYGRSPHTPRKPTNTFMDSPTCLNFGDPARSSPCSECVLMQFVPEERRNDNVPCWSIPVRATGETIDHYARCGTQLELEEVLGGWLRSQIRRIEAERAGTVESSAGTDEVCRIAGT